MSSSGRPAYVSRGEATRSSSGAEQVSSAPTVFVVDDENGFRVLVAALPFLPLVFLALPAQEVLGAIVPLLI